MSAQSNLAGFFPPSNEEMWNPNINWQAIPVHTIPTDIDHVLSAHKPCPAYDEELSSFRKSNEFKHLNDQFNNLFKYLSAHTGSTVETFGEIGKIHNTLTIETIHNKT